MYSIILMAAMTTSADVPDLGRRRGGGCHGCNGCVGSCMGCWGGCRGGFSCHGGWSCHGGCWGNSCHGCWGGATWGGGMRAYSSGYMPYSSPYAQQYNGAGYYSGYYDPSDQRFRGEVNIRSEQAPPPTRQGQEDEVRGPAPARLIVNLPADARLTIDGRATTSTSARRVFRTPPLEQGRQFVYNLRAEFVHEGRTVTRSEQVTFRAGQEVSVSFEVPGEVTTTRR
jgi:uncharacterized protein (TIGR03000 family)